MLTAGIVESEIVRIANGVFQTMLGIEVRPGRRLDESPRSTPTLSGVITVIGGWNGAILVTCPVRLAKRLATTMFGTDPPLVRDADAGDAVGEILTLIGGNLRSLFSPPTSSSIPIVTLGSDHEVALPGCVEVGRHELLAMDSSFTIALLERP